MGGRGGLSKGRPGRTGRVSCRLRVWCVREGGRCERRGGELGRRQLSDDDGLVCAMRGGQLVMDEMRSQAELDCPAAVGNCHDQISRNASQRRSFWGGGWEKALAVAGKKWHRGADADDLGNFATIKSPPGLNCTRGASVSIRGLGAWPPAGKAPSRAAIRLGGSAHLPLPHPGPQALLPWVMSWVSRGERAHM